MTAFHPALGRIKRIPDGVPARPRGGTHWLCRFDTTGVYDLSCAPHEPYGMAMRVVADEVSGPDADPALSSDAVVERERVA